MKTIAIAAIAAIIPLLFSSCTTEPQITQPKVQHGTGVMYGLVQLSRGGVDARDFDQSGSLVEVVGTSISATTTAQSKDVSGRFVLTGLDSGTYTLRFSHPGYVTVEVPGIYHNGVDSSEMQWIISDSNGMRAYIGVSLREKAPIVTADSIVAWAAQRIKIDTLEDHGQITILRDTLYSMAVSFILRAESEFAWSRENFPIGYIAFIDNNPTVIGSKQPAADYPSSVEIGRIGKVISGALSNAHCKPNERYALKSIALRSYAEANNLNIAGKEQLYLHIYPMALQGYTDVLHYKHDPPVLVSKSKYVVTATATTIPIQWQ